MYDVEQNEIFDDEKELFGYDVQILSQLIEADARRYNRGFVQQQEVGTN